MAPGLDKFDLLLEAVLSLVRVKPQKARKSLDDEKAQKNGIFSHGGFKYFFQVINIAV